MKLNPTAAYHAYNKIADHSARAYRRPESFSERLAQKAEHTDQIQISPEGTRKMAADQLSRSIMAQIRESSSPQRLESLRTAVQEGSYHIPTSELVDAVMRHCF